MSEFQFTPIPDAIAAIGRGEMVVVVDDEDRENEGDLIMAAEAVTPEKIAFFLHHTSGYICTAITGERAEQLALPPMVDNNTDRMKTAYLIASTQQIFSLMAIFKSGRQETIIGRKDALQ